MATTPIIKRVRSYRFELVDFLELYSHLPVMSKWGKAIIENVNSMDNLVTIRLINDPKNVVTTDVRDARLLLSRLDNMRGKDLNIIASLALDDDTFDGSISRESDKVIMDDNGGKIVIINLVDDNMAISVSIDDKSVETRNIPFIVAYLVRNGVDMYGLINRGFAIPSTYGEIIR